MIDDSGMTSWIFSIVIDPRIQACVVVLMDFFVVDGLMVEPDGIGTSPVEDFTRIQRCLEVQVADEGGHVWIILLEACRIAFPDLDHPVPAGEQ